MKTLENLELNVPHMSTNDTREVFGGRGCEICGGYFCQHDSGGGDPFTYPWTFDDNGQIWYGGWLVFDNHGNDAGYTYTDNGNGGGIGSGEPGGYLGL